MELQLKHIAPYLPYGLKAINTFKEKVEVLGIQNGNESVRNVLWLFRHSNGDYLKGYLYDCKPILRNLSDLTKEIEVNGEKFVPLDWLRKNIDEKLHFSKMGFNDYEVKGLVNKLHYSLFDVYQYEIGLSEIIELTEKLLELHFDIYGLIDAGLAIDINTLKD